MPADRTRLSASARYALEVISRAPRVYSASNHHVRMLARRGLVESLPADPDGATARWSITEAGRAALDENGLGDEHERS